MAKLTEEKIQCIDDLLRMLGVEFLDIRYEMVDHIASELEATEGDFKENLKQYFVAHKTQLLNQYAEAEKTAKQRAFKYYFKTLLLPISIASFTVVFAIAYYCAQYYMDRFTLSSYSSYVTLTLILPFALVSRKNKKVSFMRAMVYINGYFYCGNIMLLLVTAFIEQDPIRMLLQRISISLMAGLMSVLIISLYRCRKQYVGKYI